MVREVYGTTKALQCVATGDPPPLISWLREGRPVRSLFVTRLPWNDPFLKNTFMAIWRKAIMINKNYFGAVYKLRNPKLEGEGSPWHYARA